jgi:hypothetical protein
MNPSLLEYIIVVIVFWAVVLLMARHIDKVLGCLARLGLMLFVFLFTALVSALVVFLYYAWRH